jgi:hypothetical protein
MFQNRPHRIRARWRFPRVRRRTRRAREPRAVLVSPAEPAVVAAFARRGTRDTSSSRFTRLTPIHPHPPRRSEIRTLDASSHVSRWKKKFSRKTKNVSDDRFDSRFGLLARQ